MTYKPESFGEMVDDAVASVQAGLKDGFLQMEVEFPPVPVALDGTCRSPCNRNTQRIKPRNGPADTVTISEAQTKPWHSCGGLSLKIISTNLHMSDTAQTQFMNELQH